MEKLLLLWVLRAHLQLSFLSATISKGSGTTFFDRSFGDNNCPGEGGMALVSIFVFLALTSVFSVVNFSNILLKVLFSFWGETSIGSNQILVIYNRFAPIGRLSTLALFCVFEKKRGKKNCRQKKFLESRNSTVRSGIWSRYGEINGGSVHILIIASIIWGKSVMGTDFIQKIFALKCSFLQCQVRSIILKNWQ